MVLDEFDRAESHGFRLDVAEFLKSLSDRAIRVQVLIGGVAANLTELIESVPSIQRGLFAIRVPRMGEGELRDLLLVGESRSGLKFDESARRFIVSAANGVPYLASLLAHDAGLRAVDKSRLDVTVADVAAALAKALEEQTARVSKRSQMHIASAIQDGMMMELRRTRERGPAKWGAFHRRRSLASSSLSFTASIVPTATVKKLADAGVLVESRDEFGPAYRFAEDSLPIYLWLLAAEAGNSDKERSRTGAGLGAVASP